eukprot:CAMPEP_0171287714 /NCGR_PEP_ID=MMETSP0790-20130122/69717_1 /TAXON_ID=2925 /ORGANISM="Alexandrium catenella, Strain OF101" /LENGTH=43 /DNA_ID= /DNA_START= /DNA_END= /DNA_ORIENTATION=
MVSMGRRLAGIAPARLRRDSSGNVSTRPFVRPCTLLANARERG